MKLIIEFESQRSSKNEAIIMNEKFSDQPLTACPPTLMDQTSTHDLQTRDVYEAAEISNQNTSHSSNETCGALGQTEESRVEMQVTTRDKANDSDSDAEYLIMSRPHRKIKPVSLFSDLTTEQPVAKSNASKKKTFKPSHRTELLVQAYGKPCTICLKTIKTSSFLECTRYGLFALFRYFDSQTVIKFKFSICFTDASN